MFHIRIDTVQIDLTEKLHVWSGDGLQATQFRSPSDDFELPVGQPVESLNDEINALERNQAGHHSVVVFLVRAEGESIDVNRGIYNLGRGPVDLFEPSAHVLGVGDPTIDAVGSRSIPKTDIVHNGSRHQTP
jgi:hypothetical protein